MSSNTENTLQKALRSMDINHDIYNQPVNLQGGSATITWYPSAGDSTPQTIHLVQLRSMTYDDFRNAIRTGFQLEKYGLRLSHLIVDVHTDEEVDGGPIAWVCSQIPGSVILEEILFIALSRERGVEIEIQTCLPGDFEMAKIGDKLEAVSLQGGRHDFAKSK